uniref:radiation-inducible immediate-early gene IEX-1-like n=1 Tax=Pristiophorus japonicus TaxID=55135 RepID=UPI00398F611F
MCRPTITSRCNTLSSRTPHRTQADIFTFDTESLKAMSRCQPSRSSRRPRRVLYPATVRRYLPPQHRDRPKTWLLVLCAVVALQIYSEQPTGEEEMVGPGLPQDSLSPGLPQDSLSPGLPQDSLSPGLGLNSSHTTHPGLEQPLSRDSCAYLQLFVEATSLKL